MKDSRSYFDLPKIREAVKQNIINPPTKAAYEKARLAAWQRR